MPGPLWWAFDPASARHHGTDPTATNPDADRAVVLVDEIDKADPDVPNDLLVPLGSYEFRVEDEAPVVAEHPPLVVVTTNEERELPRAFLRRCVILALEAPAPGAAAQHRRGALPGAATPLCSAPSRAATRRPGSNG